MNAIELLRKDHRNVEDLFDRIDDVDDEDAKEELFQQIAQALTVHALIEEQHFYPAVRVKSTETLVRESFHDHDGMKRMIARLLKTDPSDDQFDPRLLRLREEVEQHILQEESQLFPLVERMLSADVLDSLGEDMRVTHQAAQEIEPAESVDPENVPATL